MAETVPEATHSKGLSRRYLSHLPAILGLLLLVGAIYVVQKEFRHLKLKDIGDALRAIPESALLFSFVWTVLSYFILTFYDRLGTIYAGHKVSYGRVAFASFCAYSLAHNLGFAAVSGAAVRYRLYAHWGLTPFQIGKTVAFCSLTFALGGLVLGGAILFIEPTTIPYFGQLFPVIALHGIGALLWAIVIGYIVLSRVVGSFSLRGHDIELPKWRMALVQVALATVDVAVTATIFYALLPDAPGLTWAIFLGVYVASYTAGLAANLPGGIGVFDTVMMVGLVPYVGGPHIVGAIIVFRLYYYIIPLFLAGGLFAGNELLMRGGAVSRFFGIGQTSARPSTRWSEPDFAVAAATGLVGVCGAMLLALGVIAPNTDYAWLDPEFAGLAYHAGQFVPSLIGAGLVLMALGLARRVNLAWGLTIVLLIAGAGFAATQDNQFWVVVMLILCVVVLAPFRSCFYRNASLLSGPFDASTALSLIVLTICVLSLVLARNHTVVAGNNAWWAVAIAPELPNAVRFAVALPVLLASVAIWLLVRPGRVHALPWDVVAARRLFALGETPPAKADGLLMGEADRAVLAFRREGRILVGLGDPSGSQSDKVSTIWRLRDLAVQEGLTPAFWRVGSDMLNVYADLGLTALPLDKDGRIAESDVAVGSATSYLVCMVERDLAALTLLMPELARQTAP